MTPDEAARTLGVATADVVSVDETRNGVAVALRDGGRRLIRDDGVYALDDHPATAQLRRFDAPEPAGEPVPEGDADGVPDGTVDEVMAWVGDDTERALAALDAENAKPNPRKSLIKRLEEL